MPKFAPSQINISPEVLRLLEQISRKQGELSAYKHSAQDNFKADEIAAIDAVHFSTRIEGNALSRDQVTEALKLKKINAPKRELQEVLNYARARKMVREWSLRGLPLNTEWIFLHHHEVLRGIVKGKLRGHFREAQCVIRDSVTQQIVYMAPEWRDVTDLMRGLLTWLRRQQTLKMSPLLLAAQFHFEFVTIHPFMDGNGRLARLLTNGILLAGGYDVEKYAALEKQHEKNRAAYYQAMRVLQAGDFYAIPPEQNIESWVLYWLRCLLATYEEALNRMEPVNTTGLDLDERLRKAESLFKRHQRLRAAEYADLAGLARTQAVADLNKLVNAGVLERVGGGRSTIYKIQNLNAERPGGKKEKKS